MRAQYLLILILAEVALFLPPAAQAQSCSQGACESWAVFDPGSGTISGGSYYENFDYDGFVLVQSYIWDPNYNYTYLGSAADYEYAEFDFSYTPQTTGTFTIAGFNYYMIEGDGWNPDGNSYGTVYATGGAPAPVISSCGLVGQSSWVIGTNQIACYGENFSGLPQSELFVLWWGDGGSDFVLSPTIVVASDGEIDVNVTLTDIIYDVGWIEIVAAGAWEELEVPEMEPPPAPQLLCSPGTVTRGASVSCIVNGATVTQWESQGGRCRSYGPDKRLHMGGTDGDFRDGDCYHIRWGNTDADDHGQSALTFSHGGNACCSASSKRLNNCQR